MYQKLQPSICLADLCLWFGFLKESFLNPVKWLDEVDGGGAGEDAPGGGGGDVGGLGAAPWRDEAEEAGARRRESHRRRKSRRVDPPLPWIWLTRKGQHLELEVFLLRLPVLLLLPLPLACVLRHHVAEIFLLVP